MTSGRHSKSVSLIGPPFRNSSAFHTATHRVYRYGHPLLEVRSPHTQHREAPPQTRIATPQAHQTGVLRCREPVIAGSPDEQPPLGFDAHQLVVDLWAALGRSVEGQFYSAADWQRARMEMW